MKKAVISFVILLVLPLAILHAQTEKDQKSLNLRLKGTLGKNASIKTVKNLIQQGADVNTFGEDYTNPLALAIRRGDFNFLKFLVEEKNANINIGDMTGTALHEAIRNKNPQMVEYLINHGADVNSTQDEENGETPIIYAARAGIKIIVEMLLGEKVKADINYRSKHTNTTAWCEAQRISQEWGNFFKELGADTNVKCPENWLDWAETDDDEEYYYEDEDYDEYYELVCECVGNKVSKATKEFIERICSNREISVNEIDTFISKGTDINAAFKVGLEGADYSEEDEREIFRPIFFLDGEALKHLIYKGANLKVIDDEGNTLLMRQLMYGYNEEIIKLLLEKKAALNIQNNKGESPLIIAIKNGNEEYVRMFLESKADPNNGFISVEREYCVLQDSFLWCSEWTQCLPLEYAAFTKQPAIAELLLKHGAKVKDTRAHLIAAEMADDRTRDDLTISDKEMADALWALVWKILAKGADIKTEKLEQNTLLYYAIKQQRFDMVKYSIEHGVNPTTEDYANLAWQYRDYPNGKDIKDYIYSVTENMDNEVYERSGYLPIHKAIMERDLEKVKEIIKADPSAAKALDDNGNTTLHVLFYSYYFNVMEYNEGLGLQSETTIRVTLDDMKPMLELLLANGADVRAKNKNGKTPLHAASRYHRVPQEFINVLLNHSAEVNAKDKFGKTPLHYARFAKIAESLIAAGADVNAVSTVLKRTPLHIAVVDDNPELIITLLNAGANKYAKDKYGQTPVDLAKYDSLQDALNEIYNASKTGSNKSMLSFYLMIGIIVIIVPVIVILKRRN